MRNEDNQPLNTDGSVDASIPDKLLDKTTCDWSGIAWSLPAGRTLRAKIEEAQRRLQAAEADLGAAVDVHTMEDSESTRQSGQAASAEEEVNKCRMQRLALEKARALAASALEEGLRAAGSVTKAHLEEVR
jgi:hypothetical protein